MTPDRSVPCPPREYLVNGGTLVQLKEKYGISHRRHGRFNNLVQLKYSQIDSPMDEPIVQESRGIILDQDNDWRVIAWPFKKFFNYGEPLAATIDWSTARVQEKLDGSMMSLYRYDGSWHVATSGMPDAAGLVQGTNKLFTQLFWETWYKKGFVEPPGINAAFTFVFELTSPLNRIVIPHAADNLTLIGMRNIWSGTEVPVRYRAAYNPVTEFELQTMDQVTATFTTMSPLMQEGYVIIDGQSRRIKVKHPGYVALHHLKSSFSTKKLVEIIRSGETAEVLVSFPEWQKPFDQVQAAYDGLVTQLEQDYAELRSIDNRKDFAMAAKLSVLPATHFFLRDSRVPSVKEGLKLVHIDKFIKLLGVEGLVLEGAI